MRGSHQGFMNRLLKWCIPIRDWSNPVFGPGGALTLVVYCFAVHESRALLAFFDAYIMSHYFFFSIPKRVF